MVASSLTRMCICLVVADDDLFIHSYISWLVEEHVEGTTIILVLVQPVVVVEAVAVDVVPLRREMSAVVAGVVEDVEEDAAGVDVAAADVVVGAVVGDSVRAYLHDSWVFIYQTKLPISAVLYELETNTLCSYIVSFVVNLPIY